MNNFDQPCPLNLTFWREMDQHDLLHFNCSTWLDQLILQPKNNFNQLEQQQLEWG